MRYESSYIYATDLAKLRIKCGYLTKYLIFHEQILTFVEARAVHLRFYLLGSQQAPFSFCVNTCSNCEEASLLGVKRRDNKFDVMPRLSSCMGRGSTL